jgi:hypothetical protein
LCEVLADRAKAAVGSGSRRRLAQRKPEKRKRGKGPASRDCCGEPPQYRSIPDLRKHLLCSASCGFIYPNQLPLGKINASKLLRRRHVYHSTCGPVPSARDRPTITNSALSMLTTARRCSWGRRRSSSRCRRACRSRSRSSSRCRRGCRSWSRSGCRSSRWFVLICTDIP